MDSSEAKSDDVSKISKELRTKLLENVYTIGDIGGKNHKVLENFGKIIDDKGQTVENYVACKKCKKVYKFINSSVYLFKHKCYKSMKAELVTPEYAYIDIESKKSLENVVMQWSIENLQPLDIHEDSGLQKLISFFISLGAKYGEKVKIEDLLPKAADVGKKIEQLYECALLELRDEINSIRNVGYGLTADVWSIKFIHESFLFITIHYIKNGELFNRFLGMEEMDNRDCTSADIRETTQEMLTEFDLTLDNRNIILTSNNENFVEAFSSNNRIYCINHLLDSALQEALNITPEVAEICDTSGALYNFLSEIEAFEDEAADVLATRWNRTLNKLTFLMNNWDEIVETCTTSDNEENSKLIENLKLDHITALQSALKPFQESFKDLNNYSGITLHLVIVHVHRLRKLCVKRQEDLAFIKKFKVNLLEAFDKFVLKNMTLQHKIALFLFPPAKKLISFSQIDKDLVRSDCKKLMKAFIDEKASDENPDFAHSTIQIDDKDVLMEFLDNIEEFPSTSTATQSKISTDLFRDFIEPTERLSSADEKVINEMRLYEDAIVSFQGDFDLLQWWHTHQVQYPLLYKVSCKILAAPASSMAVEKVIFKARNLIYENRGANSDLINETVFLHFNRDKKEMPSSNAAVNETT